MVYQTFPTQDIFQHIDRNRSGFIEELRELIKLPSISTTGQGIKECALFLKGMMEKAGIESRLLETDLHPVVFGEIKLKKGARTIPGGAHYVARPLEPVSRWTFEPFGAAIRNGKIYGRGATDCKGNL